MTHQIIVLDTETTDIENAEVIELAWQVFDISAPFNDPVAGAHHRFKNSRPCKWGALAVHHILPSDLADKPPAATAPKQVPSAVYWAGHNIDFDWKALGQPKVKRICTLAIARHIWPDLDSHTQSALTYYLFGAQSSVREKLRNAHSAAHDVRLTAEILATIVQLRDIKTADELYNFSEDCRIPLKFSFGKFKGQPIAAADRGYANWYARQSDTDPYLLEALRRARLL